MRIYLVLFVSGLLISMGCSKKTPTTQSAGGSPNPPPKISVNNPIQTPPPVQGKSETLPSQPAVKQIKAQSIELKLPRAASVSSFELSADGSRMAYCADREEKGALVQTTFVVDVANGGKVLGEFQGSRNCRLSASGKRLAVLDSQQTAVYDVDTKAVVFKSEENSLGAHFKDDNTLTYVTMAMIGFKPASLITRSLTENKVIGETQVPRDRSGKILFSPDGSEMWAQNREGPLEIDCWDTIALKKLRTIVIKPMGSGKPYESGAWVAIGPGSKEFAVYNAGTHFFSSTGDWIRSLPKSAGASPAMSYRPGHAHFVTRHKGPDDDNRWVLFDLQTSSEVAHLVGTPLESSSGASRPSGDGKKFVSAGRSSKGWIADVFSLDGN